MYTYIYRARQRSRRGNSRIGAAVKRKMRCVICIYILYASIFMYMYIYRARQRSKRGSSRRDEPEANILNIILDVSLSLYIYIHIYPSIYMYMYMYMYVCMYIL